MKSINQIFSGNPTLMDEIEVKELISYCKELEDEVITLRQKDVSVMENKLTEVVRDIYHSVRTTLKQDEDAIRFNETERVDFNETILNLKDYLMDFSVKNGFRF
jgi:hypothetical protein